MSRKYKKIIMCFLMCILLMFCFSQVIFADWDPHLNKMSSGSAAKSGGMAINVIGSVLNITQVIGMGIAIIVLVIVAIQYMVASPSSKAEIKNKATNYVLGAVLIFSGAAIIQIVKMFINANVKYD